MQIQHNFINLEKKMLLWWLISYILLMGTYLSGLWQLGQDGLAMKEIERGCRHNQTLSSTASFRSPKAPSTREPSPLLHWESVARAIWHDPCRKISEYRQCERACILMDLELCVCVCVKWVGRGDGDGRSTGWLTVDSDGGRQQVECYKSERLELHLGTACDSVKSKVINYLDVCHIQHHLYANQ